MARTREEWLVDAVRELRKIFNSHGHRLPRRILVSVGFPSSGVRSTTVAECWQADLSNGQVQIFISPTVTDRVEVLTILAHELIHALLDNEGGHSHKFQRHAKQLGLIGPWIEAHAGKHLTQDFQELAKKLGRYPNPAFTGIETEYNKQKARLLKVVCIKDDYIVRMTRMQIDRGLPLCGVCNNRMEEAIV